MQESANRTVARHAEIADRSYAPVESAPVMDTPQYAVEKNAGNCGNSPCCMYMAHPELLSGEGYKLDLKSMPMACGGDLWKPKPKTLRQRVREAVPLGLQQFPRRQDPPQS